MDFEVSSKKRKRAIRTVTPQLHFAVIHNLYKGANSFANFFLAEWPSG